MSAPPPAAAPTSRRSCFDGNACAQPAPGSRAGRRGGADQRSPMHDKTFLPCFGLCRRFESGSPPLVARPCCTSQAIVEYSAASRPRPQRERAESDHDCSCLAQYQVRQPFGPRRPRRRRADHGASRPCLCRPRVQQRHHDGRRARCQRTPRWWTSSPAGRHARLSPADARRSPAGGERAQRVDDAGIPERQGLFRRIAGRHAEGPESVHRGHAGLRHLASRRSRARSASCRSTASGLIASGTPAGATPMPRCTSPISPTTSWRSSTWPTRRKPEVVGPLVAARHVARGRRDADLAHRQALRAASRARRRHSRLRAPGATAASPCSTSPIRRSRGSWPIATATRRSAAARTRRCRCPTATCSSSPTSQRRPTASDG